MRMRLFLMMPLLAAAFVGSNSTPLAAQNRTETGPRQVFDPSKAPRQPTTLNFPPVSDGPHKTHASPPGLPTDDLPREGTNRNGRKITPQSTTAGTSGSASAPSAWTTFGALAVVIATILISAKLWKKHGPQSAGPIPHEAVELLGRRMIDQRQAIHLVRLGTRILVLGSSAAGLRTLAEISDPVEVDFLAGLCQKRGGASEGVQSFRTMFKRQPPEVSTHPATTATITTTSSRSRAERELEQRFRAAGDSSRDDSLERTHG